MSLTPYFNPTSLTTWDPYDLYPASSRSLVNLRNEAVQPLAPLMSADLIESENDFHIHIDIPGVENLQVNTDHQMLTIEADRKIRHEEQTDIAHTLERSYGKVRRRLRIPVNADVDRATAKYRDGVLTVSLPKKSEEGTKRRKLTVE